MTATIKVQVLEVCRVAPAPTPEGSATLPLSFFDVFWLRFPPNRRLFFYNTPFPTITITSNIIPRLKQSLSLTLQHYLPLSGTLTWPPNSVKPFVEYVAGDAVYFVVAESQASFDHLIGSGYHRAEEYDMLLPSLLATDNKVPVMAIQVTVFPNKGFSIGYAIHHVVMDGKSTSMFMHKWASTCGQVEGDLNPEHKLTPSCDRSCIKSQTEIEKAYLQGWMDHERPNNKSVKPWELNYPADIMYGTFLFTNAKMEKIKKWVCERYHEKNKEEVGFNLSSYIIICAFVWVCLARAQRLKSEESNFVISVDCRSRLDPPVPSTYFGNCVLFRMAVANTRDLMGEDGVVIAAQAIGGVIESLKHGVLDGAEEWIHKLFSLQTDGLYSVSGASSFEHYNTDFGWGRPKKVELVSIGKGGAFSISDCRDAVGVEIGVALSKTEIETFGSLFVSGLKAQ